ncbi:EIN3-binding F box protein 1 [Actinidia rufa]|uniref:EIN3-binding F box protein 1 n=1 Tax=Actinidia rufa TaxID=165716 RepID=A0A7J0DVJ4_9ERIC|nr:EIN3-binding F box protein 1 [Actinidia rufa]
MWTIFLLARGLVSVPLFLFSGEIFEEQQPPSIEVLPDECLFEVFRRLPGGEERSTCACVSKKWLMLLSSICGDEICTKKATQTLETEEKSTPGKAGENLACNKKDELVGSNEVEAEAVDQEIESDGYLSRCLEGKKLQMVLSLWNVSSLGDEGLYEIAKGCPLLEKLDLCQCPAISDKAVLAIAKNCPNLTSLTIESCPNIGNGSLQAVGSCCRNLTSVSIKKCPLVGDQGIASLLSSANCSLTTLKLQALTISDVSLAVIGHYGKAVTNLVFSGLENVSERGFWVMGNGQGLQKLRSITVTLCQGITDVGLEAVGKGCPNLKKVCLRKCAFLSDNGLVAFAKAAVSLEILQLEDCHRITQCGFFGVLVNCGEKLKSLSLANCLGFKDLVVKFPPMACCPVPSIFINPLVAVAENCSFLRELDVSKSAISDFGVAALACAAQLNLQIISLSGCFFISDKSLPYLMKLGRTLVGLNIQNCSTISSSTVDLLVERLWRCDILS